MSEFAVLLSVPGLREKDLAAMPRLSSLASGGATVPLAPSFPCVTCPVQAALTTGRSPREHGIVANGFFWRDKAEVEMWTAWNEVYQAPQVWDRLHEHDSELTSLAWFLMFNKGAGADYICTPAPIHNPDGTESLWCYTRPEGLYQDLLDRMGHFPLMKFWGPLASIESTDWIVDSVVVAAQRFRPRFSYIYLSHLDYAAQKYGPDSPEAADSLKELDATVGRLVDGYRDAGLTDTLWLAASEYVITPVDGAVYPNRILRKAGMLALDEREGREHLLPAQSAAWALVDHQFAHVFVQDAEAVERAAELFRGVEGIAEVLVGDERAKYALDHSRSGEIILIAEPDKWFAYYWWLDDAKAPDFARTIDIHQKPGYDPVEMFLDPQTKGTPLDASLVKGSHGCPADVPERRGVLLSSDAGLVSSNAEGIVRDVDVPGIVLRNFGVE